MNEARTHSAFRNSGSSRFVVTEHSVVKYQNPERMRMELVKTQRGDAIGRATVLYKVPRILSYDADEGSITFERMKESRTAQCNEIGRSELRLEKRQPSSVRNRLVKQVELARIQPDRPLSLYVTHGLRRERTRLKAHLVHAFPPHPGPTIGLGVRQLVGEEGAFAKSMTMAAVLNLAANAAVIPLYGGIGAAIVTASSLLCTSVWQFVAFCLTLGAHAEMDAAA